MREAQDLENLFQKLWASILEAARSQGVKLSKKRDERRFSAAPVDAEAFRFSFPRFLCAYDPEEEWLRFGALLPEPLEGIPRAVFWEVFKRKMKLPLRLLSSEDLGGEPAPGELALAVEVTSTHLRERPPADEHVRALVAGVALETIRAGLLVVVMREEGIAPTLKA